MVKTTVQVLKHVKVSQGLVQKMSEFSSASKKPWLDLGGPNQSIITLG